MFMIPILFYEVFPFILVRGWFDLGRQGSWLKVGGGIGLSVVGLPPGTG